MNEYNNEIKKCAESFEYFCENYIKLNSPTKEKIPFVLYDFQKRYISHLKENHFSICTKFRQSGFSTLTIAYLLWNFKFKKDLTIMVIEKSIQECSSISELFNEMHNSLPDWLQLRFESNTLRYKKSLETGCKIIFQKPDHAARGHVVDILFINEAAFMDELHSVWKNMLFNLSENVHVIVASTTNGTTGWFYDTYNGTINKENSFKIFLSNYTEHPLWNEEKINTIKIDLGELGFQQEFEQKFIESIKKEFKKLSKMKFKDNDKPEKLSYKDDELKDVKEINLREGYSFKCNYMKDLVEVFPDISNNQRFTTDHPHMNEDFDMSSKNLAELFEGMAQNNIEFEDAAKYWRDNYNYWESKQEEIESKIHGVFPTDMLRLAGVINKKEEKEIDESSSSGRSDILKAIVEDDNFPKSLKLSFGSYLEVNNVPTLITTNSVKNAYMGLAALWDHDKAVEFVANILKDKLNVLFGFGKE